MKPKLKRLEVERAAFGNHQFAVDDAALGQHGLQRRGELGEITVERLLVPALNEQLVAVTEDESSEAVPFWLEDPSLTVRHPFHSLGEHREQRGIDREV